MADETTGITEIIPVQRINGRTPARVNRRTGQLYIDLPMWKSISPLHRAFILFHEAGHATLGTTSEFEADNYASNAFLKMGLPVSESVKSLTEVLSFTKPEHYERAGAQVLRASAFDFKENGNEKVKSLLMNDNINFDSQIGFDGLNAIESKLDNSCSYNDFGFKNLIPGGSKISKLKKKEKELSKLKKQGTDDKQEAKKEPEKKDLKSAENDNQKTEPVAKKKNLTAIIGVVALIIVVVVVIVLFKKKKK